MRFYKTKIGKLTGTSYKEINRKAERIFREISRKSKRRPYIRSIYFNKSKIFIGLFWFHLYEKKTFGDRQRRVAFFPSAIDVLQNSRIHPESVEDTNNKSFMLHRFFGVTHDNDAFCVQIKEDKRTNEKFLISIFPYEEK